MLNYYLQGLYKLGGRSFWIHNTDPMGCLPYLLVSFPEVGAQTDNIGCAEPFNQISQYFNSKLKEAVLHLRKALPSAAITYVDVYSVKYELLSHPDKYGKPNPGPSKHCINECTLNNLYVLHCTCRV